MEKVVYLLGAGFSAPLGVPVMGNFVEKSKDQFFADSTRYSAFTAIFQYISEMAVAKNYYATDLWNIEDILSLLEMREQVDARTEERLFIEYICEVIKYYTPKQTSSVLGRSFTSNVFGSVDTADDTLALYRNFVSLLFGLMVSMEPTIDRSNPESQVRNRVGYIAGDGFAQQKQYSVVTLNYDMVLEESLGFICKALRCERRFRTAGDDGDGCSEMTPYLVKLHGCVSNENIIPPTWNKGLSDALIRSNWALAYKLLRDANYIRVIGYSLPLSDAYIKFLLRAAAMDSMHLKQIDVICLDFDGSVEQRYRDFIHFKNFRFRGQTGTKTYLQNVNSSYAWPTSVEFSWLEDRHEHFFAVQSYK